MALPPSSLVVCSRNRADLLVEAVASILAGDHVPDELVVVDQSDQSNARVASTPPTRGCEIRYLRPGTVGLSRANNAGIAAARHELLAFTHDDVEVTASWYGALVGALVAAGERTVVTGRVLPGASEAPGGFVPLTKTDTEPRVYAGRIGEDVLLPLNMAMYRSAARDVGPFDVRLGPGTPFPGAEDNDYGLRLLERGYRIAYVPAAVLHHRAWRGAADYVPLSWAYGRAQGALYAKYASRSDQYMLRRGLADFRRAVRKAIWRARQRNLTRARANLTYATGLVSGATEWLWTRHRAA